MSTECKTARNAIVISMVILIVFIIVIAIFAIMFLSSCQTVREINGNTNRLGCTHVSR